jgi:hypothetical protein
MEPDNLVLNTPGKCSLPLPPEHPQWLQVRALPCRERTAGTGASARKLPTIGTGREVERALTPAERWRLLDAADLLLTMGERSKDRKR